MSKKDDPNDSKRPRLNSEQIEGEEPNSGEEPAPTEEEAPRRKIGKKWMLYTALGLIGVAAIAFFFVVPRQVDKKANALYPKTTENQYLSVPELHADLFVADLHADTLLWNRDITEKSSFGHWDLPRMADGNVALQTLSVVTKSPKGMNYDSNGDDTDSITTLVIAQRWPVGTWSSLKERARFQAQKLSEAVRASNGQVIWVQTRQDLEELRQLRFENTKVLGVWLSLEGSHALEESIAAIDDLYSWGYRMLAPTHFFDTVWAGSKHGLQKGGLTELGKKWVRKIEDKSMIIDAAHASEKTVVDLLEYAQRPFIVSHGGARAVCNNNRNLSDELLKQIAAKGGLVGVGFWEDATCGKSVAAIVKTLLHMVDVMGEDHVALGSDFDGYVSSPIDAANVGQVTAHLVRAGVAESTIRKVMGENVYNFLTKYLP